MKNKKNASSRHNRVPNLFSRMMTVLLVAVMVIGMFPAGASAAPVTSSAEKVTPAVTPPESAPPEEGVEEEGESESTEPEEPAVEEGTEGTEGTEGIEGAEGTGGVAAAPTGGGIGILDVGDAYVTTWAEFVTAYRNNTAGVVTRIILMNSITNPASAAANRPGVTARTANLEIISDPTTSNTYTIDFGTDTTATNSLVLGTATTAHSLTLTNVKIAHAGTAAANAVVYSSTSAANAIGWTVTFNNVSQVGTTQPSPLVQQSGSGFNVVLAGTVNWNSTTVSNVITARNLTFAAGSTVEISGTSTATSTVLLNPGLAASFTALAGANVRLLAKGTGDTSDAVYINAGSGQAKVSVTNLAHVYMEGNGAGTGNDSAVMTAIGGSGGYDVLTGGVLEVHSLRTTTGYPAIIEQITNGVFNVDGAGSHLYLTQASPFNGASYGDINATLRFRSVPNQTFNVSNGGRVDVIRKAVTGGTPYATAAAIRFGVGGGHTFNVTSGGVVHVENGGNGVIQDPGSTTGSYSGGYNVGIEYASSNFTFFVDGTDAAGNPSTIEILAAQGAAINASTQSTGKFTVQNGAVFVASGRTATAAGAVVRATGGGVVTTVNAPLYYDFRNNRTGGGLIFATGTNSTFTSTNSDLAVWKAGTDLEGDPFRTWSKFNYSLGGANYVNITGTNVPLEFNTTATSYGSTGMASYSRMSGNNAKPIIAPLLQPTNADKYVRATATIPEGLNSLPRGVWTDEVWAEIEVTPVDGGGSTTIVVATSLESENIYGTATDGVLRFDNLGAFLRVGDKYRILRAWRGNADPTSDRVRFADSVPGNTVTVVDKIPPQPYYFDSTTLKSTITTAKLWQNATQLEGIWTPDAGVYADDRPVALAFAINGGAEQAPASYTITPRVGGGYSWTLTLPSTYSPGTRVQVILIDALGNRNPVEPQGYHDTTLPRAAEIVVSAVEYDVVGINARIGYEQADAITTNAGIVSVLEAYGIDLSTNAQPLAVEVTNDGGFLATDHTAKATADESLPAEQRTFTYTIRLLVTASSQTTPPANYWEEFKITVLPSKQIIPGRDYDLGFDPGPRMSTTLAGSITDAQLLVRYNVQVYRHTDNTVVVGDARYDSRIFPLTKPGTEDPWDGTFNVHANSEPTLAGTVPVKIGNGEGPEIQFSSDPSGYQPGDPTEPLYFDLGDAYTAANLKDGVTANDHEDGNLTTQVEVVAGHGFVDCSVKAKYSITYKVIDSDYNEATRTRVIWVGYNNPGDKYIIEAHDFGVKLNDVVEQNPGKNAQIISLSGAVAYDKFTGAPVSGVLVVTSDGGYQKVDGIYNIALGATGDALASAAVKGNVVDADVIDENDEYFIAAKNIARLNRTQATNPTDAQIIAWAKARAWTLPGFGSATAMVVSHNITNVNGTYSVTFGVAEEDPLAPDPAQVTITVVVADGTGPTLTVPARTMVPLGNNGNPFDYLTGVSYSDDTDTQAQLAATLTYNTPVNVNVEGLYLVNYRINDSDGHEATATQQVIVGDGKPGTKYVIWADTFSIETADVETEATAKKAQILTKSHTRVQLLVDVAGLGVAGDVVDPALIPTLRIDDGGYTNVKGEYPIKIDFTDDPQAFQDIWGRVADHVIPGDDYDLLFNDIYKSVSDAKAVTNDDGGTNYLTDTSKTLLINWADARAYLKADNSRVTNGVRVDTYTMQYADPDNDPYSVTFTVNPEPATSGLGSIFLASGTRPTITGSTPYNVNMVGGVATYDPHDGMSTNDQEDGFNVPSMWLVRTAGNGAKTYLPATINNSTVSLTTPGVYVDVYVSKDSDDNYSDEFTRVIVINDGTFHVGAKYVVQAHSFGIRKALVDVSTTIARDAQILSASYANARAWDGLTGTPVAARVDNAGGYTNVADTYSVRIRAVGDTEATFAFRDIRALVLDKKVVETDSDGSFIVGGDDFRINPDDERGILDPALVTRANGVSYYIVKAVGAPDIITGPSVPLLINNGYTGTRQGTTGNYLLSLRDPNQPATLTSTSPGIATVNVSVSGGTAPTLSFVTPLEIEIGTGKVLTPGLPITGQVYNGRLGVVATDTEDGTIDSASIVVAGDVVDVNKAWSYTVALSVTDSDNNTTSGSRVVVVNDGSIEIGIKYIVQARNFVTLLSATDGTNGEIIEEADAHAWYKEDAPANSGNTYHAGDPVDAALVVVSNAGYAVAVGTYQPITISATDGVTVDAGATRSVTGKVVDADIIDKNDNYIITIKHIEYRLGEATAAALADSGLIARSEATGYTRLSLATTAVGVTLRNNIPAPATQGLGYATYAVTADTSVNAIGRVNVTDGSKPVITVNPQLVEVQLNSALTYDVRTGVSAADDEDDNAVLTSRIVATGSVDMTQDGVYTIVYNVTDSDGNAADPVTRVVVVNNGNYTVGPNYILHAQGFVIQAVNVGVPGYEPLTLSEAKAWNSHTGAQLTAAGSVVIEDLGNYHGEVGAYTIKLAVNNDRTVKADIIARVISQTILDEDAEYYIVATPVLLNTTDYDAAQLNDLLGLALVKAWKKDRTVTEVPAKVDSFTGTLEATGPGAGTFDGVGGDYIAIFSVTEHTTTKTRNIPVKVDDGQFPTLDFSSPYRVALNTPAASFNPLDGVVAHDYEDDRDQIALNPQASNVGNVNLNAEGFYTINISVTDSDHNTTTRPRVIVVGDIPWGTKYALDASNFIIKDTDVVTSPDAAKRAHILSAAGTQVWELIRDVDGNIIAANPIADPIALPTLQVANEGGYTNVARDTPYQLTIRFTDDLAATKDVKALVYAGKIIEGDDYLLNYDDFSISVAEAHAVVDDYLGTASISKILNWGKAKVFNKATFALVPSGALVDSYDIQPNNSQVWHAIYSVRPEPATKATANVTVAGGNPPVVTAPGPYEIIFGGTYNPLDGVSAYDVEDTPRNLPLPISLVNSNGQYVAPTLANSNVDLTTPGVYVDYYTAKDSDDNYAQPVARVVVVNDGTFKMGEKYIVKADSFAIRKADVTGTNDQIREKSHAQAWSASTGATATAIVVDNGSYAAAEGTYTAVIGVAGDEATTPDAAKALRTIKIRVIDRAVITDDGHGHFVGANSFALNSTEETGITDASLLTRSDAVAYTVTSAINQPDSIATVNAVVASYAGSRSGTLGNYDLVVAHNANPATTATVKVNVANGNKPIISFVTPYEVQKGDTSFTLMTGVSAVDTEDGTITGRVTTVGSVDVNTVGVYTVEYSVVDSDFQRADKTRVIIVNDGSITIGFKYIVQARSFVTLLSTVTGSDAEILSLSGARAWYKEEAADGSYSAGQLVMGALTVVDKAGYTAAVGTYQPIKISATDGTTVDTAATRSVTGKVVDGDIIETNDDYTITAKHITYLLGEATAAALSDTGLIARSEATGYNRSDLSDAPVKVAARNNIPAPATPGSGTATYAVIADDTVDTQGNVSVISGNRPVITVVPLLHKVDLDTTGAVYDPYFGVSATDTEDGPYANTRITLSGDTVDLAVDGVYTIYYNVTDNDGNAANQVTRVVVVDDGTYTVTDNYVLRARGFVIKGEQALTGDQAQVLAKSKSQAWNARTGAPVSAFVFEFGGYSSVPATYDLIIAVTADTTVQAPIKAVVISQTILIEDGRYYIAADPVRMNPVVDQTKSFADLVTLANVTAWKDERTPVAKLAEATRYTGNFDGTIGNYFADFLVTENPDTKALNVPVDITTGAKPTLDFTNPYKVAVGASATALDGVTARDVEDDIKQLALVPQVISGNVDFTTEGIYVVIIGVTDSDYNTTTKQRTIVVGDYVVGDKYILGANDFYVHVDDVVTSPDDAKRAHVLGAAGVEAWELVKDGDGNIISTTPIADPIAHSSLQVPNYGGYTNVAQDDPYLITIRFTDDPTATKDVKALVYAGKIIVGDNYLLTFTDFSISVAEAKTVVDANRMTTAAKTQILAWGNAKAYVKEGIVFVPNGAQVDDYNIQANRSNIWHATYSVILEPATKDDNNVTIIGGEAPVVSATTPVEIAVGGSYNVMANVSVTDAEDGTNVPVYLVNSNGDPVAPTLANSNVNVNVAGVYTDVYTARDSDDNLATPVTRVVVVNDGTYSVGNSYILRAHSYGIKKVEVDGTHAEILARSQAQAWSAITGDPATPVVRYADGYYNASQDTYAVTLAVAGDAGAPIPGNQDAGKALRNITIKVIDRDIVEEVDGYIVAANNFRINTADENGVSDETLLSRASAVAYILNDSLTQVLPFVASYTGHRNGDKNLYDLVIGNSAHRATTATVKVNVSDGTLPILNVSTPIEIQKGSAFSYTAGVSAADAEDGNLTARVTYTQPVDVNRVDVYTVTYSVTDNDHNTVTATRVVVVNDGSIQIGDTYIVKARNFVTLLADVSGTDTEIISKSGAMAWNKTTGAVANNLLVVADKAGYTAAVGTYSPIKIQAVGDTASTRSITGKVVNDKYIEVTDDYIITANDVSMLLSQADLSDASLITKSGAVGYVRSDLSNTPVRVAARDNIPAAGATGTGKATYAIVADAAVAIAANVTVTAGNPPVLTVNPITQKVNVDTTGAVYNFTTGVSATDQEDGTNVAITHTGDVNLAIDGVYPVVYTATDSDGNTDTKTRVVVVDDGTYVVTDAYILRARGFVIKGVDVLVNNQAQVLSRSEAAAWNARTGAPVNAVVTNFGGYKADVGTYTLSLAVDLDRNVAAQVTAAVIAETILIKDGHYYIAANPVKLNSTVYSQKGAGDLIDLASVKAWKDDQGLTSKSAQVDGFTGTTLATGKFDGAAGNYFATFSVTENPATKAVNVPVNVADGQKPTIDFVNPLRVTVGTSASSFNPVEGITARDAEDDLLGLALVPTAQNVGNVDLNIAGVYVVTVSVTDSDYNTTTKNRTVVVDDGNFAISADHIVWAKDFEIAVAAVETSTDAAKTEQLIRESGAKAWNTDGSQTYGLSVRVANDGGYTTAQGTYVVKIEVAGDTVAVRGVAAKVKARIVNIRFIANGAVAQPQPSVLMVVEPDSYASYTPWGPARDGYTFLGWNTAANGTGQVFNNAYRITESDYARGELSVYAQWSAIPPVVPPVTPPGDTIVNITNPPATIINQAGGAVERIVETVREFVLPSAEEPAVTLPDVDVPLTTITPQQTWSLLNLLFSLIGIALVIVTMIIRVVRKDKKGNEQVLTADQAEEEKKHANSQRLWLIGALAFAVVSLLLFAFTSPTLDYKMVLSNDWTVLHGVLFVLTFIASILVFRNTGNKNASEEAQIEAY